VAEEGPRPPHPSQAQGGTRDGAALSGCVALVTGASAGIGRHLVQGLAAHGAAVAGVARTADRLTTAMAEVAEQTGAPTLAVVADVTDADAVQAVVDDVVARFGRIDVVVHSAQVMAYGRIEDVPAPVYDRVVDTALHGTANLARSVLPVFRRQGEGHLVVVSSLLAQVATPLMGSYVAAKWGQLGLVRSLQLEVRDVPGIAISAVACGGVNTPIYFQGASYMGSTGRPPPPVYSPERVARRILAVVDRPRRYVHAGFLNPFVVAGFRLLPGVYDALVGPLLKTFAVARDQVGPTEGNVFSSRPDTNAERGRWRSL
jgi:NAD(P)-dependent dehydrogenase (short-subunit alcohol dehydrogenase family)